MGEPPTVTTIEDGDTFSFDGIELTVNHVSGHAAGLCLFELDLGDKREVVTGDALRTADFSAPPFDVFDPALFSRTDWTTA